MEKADQNQAPTVVGATTDLPHDRLTVERFRTTFPRARWNDELQAWFVPGQTAQKRIGRWLAEMEAEADAFADEKGRDAFAFDPIESRYLEAAAATLQIRTPYSKILVHEIREIPYARWDGDRRLWTVPYRSFEDLRRRWPTIEAAAERSEPEARKARQAAIEGTVEDAASKAKTRERRRKRNPVPVNNVPPFDHAIATHIGIVFFIGTDGEVADEETVRAFYFDTENEDGYVWASWRQGSLEELVTTWPARLPPSDTELQRGWWIPTLDGLRDARRDARSKRKSRQRRNGATSSSERSTDGP